MKRQVIIEQIKKEKLIVIIRGVEKEKLIQLTEAMYNGGVRLLEITYDSKRIVSDKETSQAISMLCDHFGDRMIIGAGTVLTEEQVKLTKQSGGSFVISPNTNKKVIDCTVANEMLSIPGALTPSEVEEAYECGADFVKLFPVTSLGTDYVKAIRAPLSHIPLLAVGGIDLNNIKKYLRAGICGVGIGSNIVDKNLLAQNNWNEISRLADQYHRSICEG